MTKGMHVLESSDCNGSRSWPDQVLLSKSFHSRPGLGQNQSSGFSAQAFGKPLQPASQSTLQAASARLWMPNNQKRCGDPNPQYFSKSTAVQMGGVLPYKWEVYCSTNGRRTAGFPFLRSLEARKVRRYKRGAYCCTNWRCTAVLFRQVVGVGIPETLPKQSATKNITKRHSRATHSQSSGQAANTPTPCSNQLTARDPKKSWKSHKHVTSKTSVTSNEKSGVFLLLPISGSKKTNKHKHQNLL